MLPSYASSVSGDINAERLPDAVAATNLVQMKRLDAAVAAGGLVTSHDRRPAVIKFASVSLAASAAWDSPGIRASVGYFYPLT